MGRGPSIEGRKSVEDSKRARIFTRLIREITVAARTGGAEPSGNARLRLAIERAHSANMTKDTIERAIKRGSGGDGHDQTQEIRYEGYAPGGVAILVDCVTDNATRTVAEVRNVFSKHGGSLGNPGSVAFQFSHLGVLDFETSSPSELEEKILTIALETGADDVRNEGSRCLVLTQPGQFESVKAALLAAGISPVSAQLSWRPLNPLSVSPEVAASLRKLIDHLDALDDVQEIHHNAEPPGAA